jgi:CDP-6-deoxy-D-xylo-4-hexulose-3-dehydrase
MKQPAYSGLPRRVVGTLTNADTITTNTFWIGVHPGLGTASIDYMIESIHDFVETHA